MRWPCFYGIDFATRAELLAGALDSEGVRRSIGSDSLGYVSLEGLIGASEQPRTRLCMACFDGDYPIPLPEEARMLAEQTSLPPLESLRPVLDRAVTELTR